MIKKIISYILVFILILLLTASISLSIISQTILKKDFMVSMLQKNEYYYKTYNEIMENFKKNTIQSGLGEEVLEGIITEDQVRNDVNSFIYSLYGQGEMTLDKEIVKTRLQENIDKVIEENNKKVTKNEQEEIDIYVDTIAQIYEDGIAYAKTYVSKISSVVQKAQKLVNTGLIIGYVATAVLLVILIVMNRAEVLKYISIALMGSGALLIVPKIIELSTLQIHNILLFNLAFSKVLIALIETVISYFLGLGIIFLILGVMVSIFYGKMNKE